MDEFNDSNSTDIHTTTSLDNDRPSPTMSDAIRPSPTMSERSNDHTLTSREVLMLFDQAELPRSQRSIERYCKDGKLDAFYDSDEQRYYVAPASVARLIGHLKELQLRHAQPQVESEMPTLDLSRQPTPQAATAETVDTKQIKELEDKIMRLEIDKEARGQVITVMREEFRLQVEKDRDHYTELISSNTLQIGKLQAQLLQLAPVDDDPDKVKLDGVARRTTPQPHDEIIETETV